MCLEYKCVQFLQRPVEGRAVDLLVLTSSCKLLDVGAGNRASVSTIAEPSLQPPSPLSTALFHLVELKEYLSLCRSVADIYTLPLWGLLFWSSE